MMEDNTLTQWLVTPINGDPSTLLTNCVDKVSPLLSYGMAKHFGYTMKEWGFLKLDDWLLVYAASSSEIPRILEDLYETGLRCMNRDIKKNTNKAFPLEGIYACKTGFKTLEKDNSFYKVSFKLDNTEDYVIFEMKKDVKSGEWQILVCFASED